MLQPVFEAENVRSFQDDLQDEDDLREDQKGRRKKQSDKTKQVSAGSSFGQSDTGAAVGRAVAAQECRERDFRTCGNLSVAIPKVVAALHGVRVCAVAATSSLPPADNDVLEETERDFSRYVHANTHTALHHYKRRVVRSV